MADDDLQKQLAAVEKLIDEKLQEAGVHLAAPVQFAQMQGELVVQMTGVVRDKSKLQQHTADNDAFMQIMQAEKEAEREQKKIEEAEQARIAQEELERLARGDFDEDDDG